MTLVQKYRAKRFDMDKNYSYLVMVSTPPTIPPTGSKQEPGSSSQAQTAARNRQIIETRVNVERTIAAWRVVSRSMQQDYNHLLMNFRQMKRSFTALHWGHRSLPGRTLPLYRPVGVGLVPRRTPRVPTSTGRVSGHRLSLLHPPLNPRLPRSLPVVVEERAHQLRHRPRFHRQECNHEPRHWISLHRGKRTVHRALSAVGCLH